MSVEVVILGFLAVIALLSAYQSYQANKASKAAADAKASAVAAHNSLAEAAAIATETKEILEDTHKIVNSQRDEMIALIKAQAELIESLREEIRGLKP